MTEENDLIKKGRAYVVIIDDLNALLALEPTPLERRFFEQARQFLTRCLRHRVACVQQKPHRFPALAPLRRM